MQKDLDLTAGFKDHFSRQSRGYARFRPTYPAALFEFLSELAPGRDRAWDCATGNGQAAAALAPFFRTVIATDASRAQIDAAQPHDRVTFVVATAESSGLDDASVDLITVAQAFHWFDEQGFFAEACRVARQDAVLALWSYALCTVDAACDAIVETLYGDIVAAYWPPERALVEQGYAGVVLPGTGIAVPDFTMWRDWAVSDMLGYLRTWSACNRYQADRGSDPVLEIEAPLRAAWGGAARRVVWPLSIKASRIDSR